MDTGDSADVDQIVKECLRVVRHTNTNVQSVQSAATELQQQVKILQTQLQEQQAASINLKSLNLGVSDYIVLWIVNLKVPI